MGPVHGSIPSTHPFWPGAGGRASGPRVCSGLALIGGQGRAKAVVGGFASDQERSPPGSRSTASRPRHPAATAASRREARRGTLTGWRADPILNSDIGE